MTDLFMEIHNAMLDDPVISKYFKKGDIEFFIHPNAKDISQNVIVIDEVFSPSMTDFADNAPLTYEYLLQIDLFVKQSNNQVNGSLLCRELILRVSKVMWEKFSFGEFNSFKTEFYPDFKIYQASKQYRGKKYINEEYL